MRSLILAGRNNENKHHRALAGDESFSEPTEICFKGAYEEVPFNYEAKSAT